MLAMVLLNQAENRLRAYIKEKPRFLGAKVKFLKEGQNRYIFLLKINKDKFIARVGRKIKDSGSSIKTEVKILTFLQTKNIDFVPKIVDFDKNKDISIEEYAGVHTKMKSLSLQKLDQLACNLNEIHKINVRELDLFCKQNSYKKLERVSLLKEFNIYGKLRFKKAKKLCPSKDVLKWIAPKLSKTEKILTKTKSSKNYHLLWGDIGNNICVKENKVYFIDWEFSRIGIGSDLPYCYIHSHFSKKQFEYLVKKYSEYSKRPEPELWQEIYDHEKVIRLNDVVWAAMKWGEHKGTLKEFYYKKKTFDRIELFEKMEKTKHPNQ